MSEATDFRVIRPVSGAFNQGSYTSAGGTYYNRAGVQQTAPANTLRVSYDPLDLTAPPRVLLASGDVFSGSGLVYCNAPITEAAYGAGTTYAAGAQVYDTATGDTYTSLTAGNVGKALSNTAYWLKNDLPVNRMIAFDKAVNSQTTNPDLLVMCIVPGALVSDLMLLNISGARVTVEQPKTGYRKTVNLASHPVTSWYEFYTEEPEFVGDAYFENLLPSKTEPIVIIIESYGGLAGLGCCFPGKSKIIGQTLNGLEGGVNSFSTTKTDGQGNMRLVRRPNARRMSCEVYVYPGMEDFVYRLMSDLTDREIAVIASTEYTMTYQYGFLGQWSLPLDDSGTPMKLEFKALI